MKRIMVIVATVAMPGARHRLAAAEPVRHFAADSLRGTLARDHQPRLVFHAGKHKRTYMTYLDHNFDARITYYDHDTRRWANVVRVDDCRTRDGHNTPAPLITRDGTIHLFYGCHNHPVKYARSARPEDITRWRLGKEIGSKATYTYAIQIANGDLLLFYRFGGAGRRSPLKAHRSTDCGKRWDKGTVILDYGKQNWAKIRDVLYDPATNRVHLALWELSRKHGPNCYYCQYDPTSRHLLAVNGKDLGPMATKDGLLAGHCRVAGRDKGRTTFDMALHKSAPAFAVQTESKGRKRYHFAAWDGRQWVKTPIPVEPPRGLVSFELYTKDGVEFRLYGVCVTDPPTPYSGGDLMVWTSRDRGKTWDAGRALLDRRTLGHGLTGLDVCRNYPGSGPFLIVQEEWTEKSKDLPRHLGSILDDAPFRFNKRLYALDGNYEYLMSPRQ